MEVFAFWSLVGVTNVGVWLGCLKALRTREGQTFIGYAALSHRVYQHSLLLFGGFFIAAGLSDFVRGLTSGETFGSWILLFAMPTAALLACGPAFLTWRIGTYIVRPAYTLSRESIVLITRPKVIAAYSLLAVCSILFINR